MGDNRQAYKLSDIAKLRNGAAIKQEYFTDAESGVNLIKVSNFTMNSIDISGVTKVDIEHAKKWITHRIKANDILIATVGSWPPNWSSVVGKVVRAPSETHGAIQNQNTCCIIPSKQVDQNYLYYLLKTQCFLEWIVNSAQGSANQARVPVKNIGDFSIELPSIDYQAKISKILNAMDVKIDLNRQINQTLEQMAQTLFKSWFVDFDPAIDNALEAGFFEQDLAFSDELLRRVEIRKAARESDNFKPLSEDIRQLFPDAFEECTETALGLGGWVPKGWQEVKLSDLVDTVSKTYPLKTVEEVIFLNTGDIENGSFLHTTYSSVNGLPGQAKKSIQKGDILFSEIRPKNKRFAFVSFESNDYVVSTKLMVLRAKNNFNPLFAYFLLTLNETTDELQRIAELRSGTFPQITFNELSLIKFVFPAVDSIVGLFSTSYLEPFFEKSSFNRQESESLTKLRDTLLPKLISGELSLKDIKIDIPEETLI